MGGFFSGLDFGSAASLLGQIFGGISQNKLNNWNQAAVVNVLNALNGYNGYGLDRAQQVYNPLLDQLGRQTNYGNMLAYGDGNNPGLMFRMDNGLSQYMGGLQGMYNTPYSNPQLDQIMGQMWDMGDRTQNTLINPMGDVMDNRGILSPEQAGLYDFYQSMQNNPMLGTMGSVGQTILNNSGQTGFSQTASDRGIDALNGGGANAMTTSMLPFAQNYLQGNGYTPQLNQLFNMGSGYAQDPSQGAYGAFGNSALSQGNQFLDNAQGYGGAVMNQALGNGGYTGGLGDMSQQGYNTMGAGTLTPGLASEMQRGLELSYDTGYTPEIYKGLNAGYDLLGDSGMGGGAGMALSMGSGLLGDTGYTDSINKGISQAQDIIGNKGMTPELQEYFKHSMDLYNGAPGVLRPMDEAISQARDQASTAANQQAEKMMQQATLRGGGAGVIGSGLQNNRMAEFSDQRAQAEAAALREAAKNQEALFLQQQATGGQNAGNALSTAANNLRTGADLSGNMESAAASRHNASVSAGANLVGTGASLAAQQRAAALNNASSLILGLNNTAANRYGTSMGASTSMLNNANNDETQRYLGNLQYGSNLIGNSEQIGSQRYGQELGAGTSLLNPQVGSNLIDSGYSNYGNIYSNNLGQGFNAMRSGAGLANDLVQNYSNMIPQLDSLNNQRLSIYGNIANQGEQNDISRLQQGSGMINNYYNDLLQNGNQQQNFFNNASQNFFNAGNQMGQGYNSMFNLYNNMYGNYLGSQQFGMNNNNSYANAMNQAFGQQGNLLNSALGGMFNGTNNMNSLLGQYLGYSGQAISGLPRLFQAPQMNPWTTAGLGTGGK